MAHETLPAGQFQDNTRAAALADVHQKLFAVEALARLLVSHEGQTAYKAMDGLQQQAIVGDLADRVAESLRVLDMLEA